ncbi:MAG: sugar ABC transporter permease [Planctomycetes bacterium]|nr:sugar ABC transporter permease [Planctomycetota bacterium]
MKIITWRQALRRWQLYLLVLPSLALILTFSYFPAASAIYHAFFRWNGDEVSEWVGLENFWTAVNDKVLLLSFGLVGILIVSNLVKMIPSIITAVVIHRLASERWRYLYRVAFVIPMIIPGMVWLLIWKYFYDPTVGVLNSLLDSTGLMPLLQWMDSSSGLPAAAAALGPYRAWLWVLAAAGAVVLVIGRRRESAAKWAGLAAMVAGGLLLGAVYAWPQTTGAFNTGAPAWLGQAELVVPALIFWGFPWVGVVSVLLYLAGLGNIGQDIYDAAEIDGCGWFRKFWNIELPLITTQVRLNLILMIIGTLQGWGLIFILLGDNGGPNGAGMVPGLYMFRKAFSDMEAGYACAIGLLLFFLTLILTVINNRYVRVSK